MLFTLGIQSIRKSWWLYPDPRLVTSPHLGHHWATAGTFSQDLSNLKIWLLTSSQVSINTGAGQDLRNTCEIKCDFAGEIGGLRAAGGQEASSRLDLGSVRQCVKTSHQAL